MKLKKCSISALLLFFSASLASGQYSISLPYQNVVVKNTNGTAVFQGAPVWGDPGQPQLPHYTVSFLLPPDADFSNITVEIRNPVEKQLDGTFEVNAALPPSTRGEIKWPFGRNIIDGKDMDVYGKNSFFPADYRGKISFGSLRQYRLVEVIINPFEYNPVSKKLRMLTGGSLVITMPVKNSTSFQALPAQTPRDSSAEMQIKKKVANPELLQNYNIIQPQNGTPQSSATPSVSKGYAIITTDAIKNSSTQLANLINVKKQKGYNVITATESVWGGGTGDIAANRIRTWLKNNYLAQNIQYVLLIGNPDPSIGSVPMKMCWPQLGDAQYPEAPTDFFYAELSGNWDVNNDGFYGDFSADCNVAGGADQYAEVAVGRIPF